MNSPFLDRSRWLAENYLAVAVDQHGYEVSPGHCLVVPKRVVPTVLDMTELEWLACLDLVRQMVAELDGRRRPDGYNIGMNCGAAAGQTVYHAHIHIIPRYSGDHPNPRGGVRAVIPGKSDYTAGGSQ